MKIDVHARTLSIEFRDTYMKFNIFEVLKHPVEDHSIFSIDAIDGLMEEYFQLGIGDASLADFVNISDVIDCFCIVAEKADSEILSNTLHFSYFKDSLIISVENIKKEVTKLLAAGIIYPISNSQWVSPVQVVPKKSGMMVIKIRQDEMVPAKIQNSWRVCIDYRKLNQATRKEHFLLSFVDQVLEKLAGYMQIHIALVDQHKTTFTCQFRTFTYTRISFRHCNAPSTFQKCMINIFSDLFEDCMEVFMDNLTVYVESFEACLDNLSRVLRRCIESSLVLNFEKCHFMVTKGIIMGHLVLARGIKVDKAKIDVISSLPNPASVFTGDSLKILARLPCLCPSCYRRMPTLSLTSPVWTHFKSWRED
ncbi:Retrovirus-related Pol polyprotein, partial [Mucuna pruriens]